MNKTVFLQIFVIALIVAGYFFIDFNKIYESLKGETAYNLQDKTCSLKQGPCEIVLKDGNIFTLEVFPKDIPLMKNLNFKLTTTKEVDNLKLNIYATNMFMGDFILDFKKVDKNTYEAKGTLPTCPIGNMKWNADIKIDKLVESYGARFGFQTTR